MTLVLAVKPKEVIEVGECRVWWDFDPGYGPGERIRFLIDGPREIPVGPLRKHPKKDPGREPE